MENTINYFAEKIKLVIDTAVEIQLQDEQLRISQLISAYHWLNTFDQAGGSGEPIAM